MIHLLYRPDQHFALEAAAYNNIMDARPVFDSLDWSEESYRMYEEIGRTGNQVYICYSPMDEVRILYIYVLIVFSYICLHA